MKPKLVYIAGPYSAETPLGVHRNIERARETMAALVESTEGLYPLCPHTMTEHFDGTRDYTFWVEATLEMLRRCDAVLLTTTEYAHSSGTVGEIKEAHRLGIPAFRDIYQLRASRWYTKHLEE